MRTPPNERVASDIVESAAPGASGSQRRCVLSGETMARETLVRLAISPDGDVLPDPAAKAPGRGAWIKPNRVALEQAMSDGHLKRGLARAFKGAPLRIGDDLPVQIERALTGTLMNRLGLELRAGNLVLGSGRISDEARSGALAMLLHACDSSEDGRKKLDQAWRVGRMIEGSGERGTVLPLDRAALSVALGRDNVVHLGVVGSHRDSKPATRIARDLLRLLAYQGQSDATSGDDVSSNAGHRAAVAAHDEYLKD